MKIQTVKFKNYLFYYEYSFVKYMMDDESLIFFKIESENDVMMHVSFQNNKLIIRPRYGVTFQKIASKEYKIIVNK